MVRENRKFVIGILVFLFFSNFFAFIVVFDLSRLQCLEVNFFNVGQGDAILIETPQRHQILIDGGPNPKILEKLAKEIPFWKRTIDLIILTHPEKDHLTGLLEVLKKYKVENILWTGIVRKIPEYDEWQRLIKEERAKVKISKSGQKISCENCDWKIEILYPFENLEGVEFENSNDTSIVSKLIFENISFLFTGDISKNVEYLLSYSRKLEDINSDILKIAHHGSKTSTSENFLEKVSPEIAVISVGKENPYGHPHEEVLEILEKYGIKILRTDKDDDIKIIADGKNYEVSNFQNKN